MNTELEPPRVPPLDPARRAELRNRVMDKSRPTGHHPARRWVAPAVSVAAVAAVVAGTLIVSNRPSDGPAVAGPATAATPTRSGLEAVTDAEATAAFAKSCERGGHLKLDRPMTVVWARRVPAANPRNTDVLMILKGSGASGRAICLAPSGASMWAEEVVGAVGHAADAEGGPRRPRLRRFLGIGAEAGVPDVETLPSPSGDRPDRVAPGLERPRGLATRLRRQWLRLRGQPGECGRQ